MEPGHGRAAIKELVKPKCKDFLLQTKIKLINDIIFHCIHGSIGLNVGQSRKLTGRKGIPSEHGTEGKIHRQFEPPKKQISGFYIPYIFLKKTP